MPCADARRPPFACPGSLYLFCTELLFRKVIELRTKYNYHLPTSPELAFGICASDRVSWTPMNLL